MARQFGDDPGNSEPGWGLFVNEPRRDLAQRKSIKVKLPIRQHIKLHALKLFSENNISETVEAALDMYFEQMRQQELATRIAAGEDPLADPGDASDEAVAGTTQGTGTSGAGDGTQAGGAPGSTHPTHGSQGSYGAPTGGHGAYGAPANRGSFSSTGAFRAPAGNGPTGTGMGHGRLPERNPAQGHSAGHGAHDGANQNPGHGPGNSPPPGVRPPYGPRNPGN